ncbi:hypothetical protein BWQ96_09609 [Gracilariopsis chorda]|uniref:Uncharacterized protein n=1 Tax=Gracilariopsis chorda TaxID=448386 RepID=A0A2V3IF13_9FLOR|nr:hypothetical protein BWQ96_09609 [Gracilariopsis chorda]|eukprot:PXF40676.1 hypothetical protein BWQ96_09609 [Gracilariopsis chorda]
MAARARSRPTPSVKASALQRATASVCSRACASVFNSPLRHVPNRRNARQRTMVEAYRVPLASCAIDPKGVPEYACRRHISFAFWAPHAIPPATLVMLAEGSFAGELAASSSTCNVQPRLMKSLLRSRFPAKHLSA